MEKQTAQQKDHEQYDIWSTCKKMVNHVRTARPWLLPAFCGVVGYSQTGTLSGAAIGIVFGIGVNRLTDMVYEYVTSSPEKYQQLKNWVFKKGPQPTE